MFIYMGSKHWKKTKCKPFSNDFPKLTVGLASPVLLLAFQTTKKTTRREAGILEEQSRTKKLTAFHQAFHGISWHFMAFHGSIHELTGHFAPVSDGGLTVDVAGQGTGAQRWNSNTRFYGFEIDFVFFCKSVRIYNFVGRHQSVTWSISKNISQKKQLACHTRRCCKHAGVAARSLSEKHFAWQVGSKLLSNSLLIDSLPGLEWGLQMDQAAGSWDWEV